MLKPSTLLGLHRALGNRKYRLLFSSKYRGKPGPKGPNKELIEAVVQMKLRNPAWGCPRIAQQIALAFDIPIDKDVVRRILASHYRSKKDSGGPSWLTLIGHLKDSLWSLDLFRCESATLRTHWVLIVMDQYTRRIIGFGVHAGTVNGVALCRMFNRAIRWLPCMPNYLSSDHDPLYRFGQWQANLRILEVTEIKIVPYVPLSHPFVERLIGTIRREYLDRTLFSTTADLENKLLDFRTYFNAYRSHTALEGRTPDPVTPIPRPVARLHSYGWHATAEASITPQWLPDSPKTGAPCGNWRTSAGGHFLRNHSLFEFVNAERLSDLIVSLLPRVLRQCALASPGRIAQHINSQWTGSLPPSRRYIRYRLR